MNVKDRARGRAAAGAGVGRGSVVSSFEDTGVLERGHFVVTAWWEGDDVPVVDGSAWRGRVGAAVEAHDTRGEGPGARPGIGDAGAVFGAASVLVAEAQAVVGVVDAEAGPMGPEAGDDGP